MIFHPDKIPSTPRVNRAGGQQTMVTAVLSFLAIVWNQGVQTVTISQGTCNFTPFAGNPMTEMVSISVAGSAYFMVGAQGGRPKSLLLDRDCKPIADLDVGPTNVVAARSEGLRDFEVLQAVIVSRLSGGSPKLVRLSLGGQDRLTVRDNTSLLSGRPFTNEPQSQFKMIAIPGSNGVISLDRGSSTAAVLEYVDLLMSSATQYATTVPTTAVSTDLTVSKDGSTIALLYLDTGAFVQFYQVSDLSKPVSTLQIKAADNTANRVRAMFDSLQWTRMYIIKQKDLFEIGSDGNRNPIMFTLRSTTPLSFDLGQLCDLGARYEYLLVTQLAGPRIWLISKLGGSGAILPQQQAAQNIFSTVSLGYQVEGRFLLHELVMLTSPGNELSSNFAVVKYQFKTERVECSNRTCPQLILQTNSWDSNSRTFTIKFNAELSRLPLRNAVYIEAVRGKPKFPSGFTLSSLETIPSVVFDVDYTSDGKGITGRMKLPTKETDVYLVLLSSSPDGLDSIIFRTGYETYSAMPIVIKVGEYIPRPDPKPPLNGLQTAVVVIYRVIVWSGVLAWPILSAACAMGGLSVSKIFADTKCQTAFHFVDLVKTIDTLAYTYILNNSPLKEADAFLTAFRVSPWDLGFNMFTATEPQVVCDPPQPISAGGYSCSVLQNIGSQYTTFVILAGLCLLTYLTQRVFKTPDETGAGTMARGWRCFVWGLRKVFSWQVLGLVFDSLQIEAWRYSFITFDNFQRSVSGLSGAMVFAIFLVTIYAVYGVVMFMLGLYHRHGTEETKQSRLTSAISFIRKELQWMDGMFEDFLSPDEIPHKVLYYMPFWQYLRVFSIQVMVVFWSGLGPDQLKLICYVELCFCLASFTANHYKSGFRRWNHRVHTSCLFVINFFFLLNEYTAENSSPAEKSAYSIVISIFITLLFVNAVVHCGRWIWVHKDQAQQAQSDRKINQEEEIRQQTDPEQEQPKSSDSEQFDSGLGEHPPGYNRMEIKAKHPLPSKQRVQLGSSTGGPERSRVDMYTELEVAQEQSPVRDDSPMKRMQMVKSHHLSGMS